MSEPHAPKPYGDAAGPPTPRQRASGALNLARQAARPTADQATNAAQQALHSAVETFGRLTASLRGARDQRSAARAGRRPDGTPVSPSPAGMRHNGAAPSGARGGVIEAIKERWALAVQEGKLAAREKEADVRASYERRVRHDAHLHAEQHRRPIGSAAQPKSLPPASMPNSKQP